MRDVILVAYDQLSRRHGALGRATPETHEVLLIDSDRMLRSRTWGAQRLFLILAAAEHLADELARDGFTVHRRQAATVATGVAQFRRDTDAHLLMTHPSSFALTAAMTHAGVELVDDDSFLTSRADFTAWVSQQKSLRMETFYRWQRTRLGVLMEDGKPVGGTWNLDAENRLPPPRGGHAWPEVLHHPPDRIDEQVWSRLQGMGLSLVGDDPDGTWATSREGALRQLRHFLDTALADFGPYEDAMPADSWAVNHSLLSPYLNLGLLDPAEVVAAALARFAEGGIPLASCEGFVRQVIGWREYVRGLYWHLGDDYRQRNGLAAHRPLLPLLEDPSLTQMACLSSTVTDLHARGWVHHIPRLMLLSNLALLTGVEPLEFLEWMRRMFVDAHDWVMVPNVIGMGLHADDGLMMTKPYAAGGAYIHRMGRHCGSCRYDPKRRTGESACPFTTLYWDFLDRHRDRFLRNHRMAQQVRGLDRLTDLPEVRERAAQVLEGLTGGTI